MTRKHTPGGIVLTYQKYDPRTFPSPTAPPPDIASTAMEHMLMFGSLRELSDEELARAVRLDPSQFANLGPSIDALIALLLERKRKILERYETETVQKLARRAYRKTGKNIDPPQKFRERFRQAFEEEQIYDLEQLWYSLHDDTSPTARGIVQLVERLGDKYQVEELAARYDFTGREPLTVEEALAVKEELEKIDELLEQLAEARETAQIGIVDLDALSEFTEPGDIENLSAMQQQVEDYLREAAERQGITRERGAFQLTPQAYRIFQSKLLDRIFSDLTAARSGRHTGPIIGEGAVELQQTAPYEFGDSIANMDITQSLTNAMIREAGRGTSENTTTSRTPGGGIRLTTDDIEIHRTRNSPKSATAVIMDMSGSMRYDGQYINVKRMALALEGLIRSEFPGDYLHLIEMFSFAKPCPPGGIAQLMPKPVYINDPVVRLRADMSRDDVSETQIPPHFTNIQHSLQMARQFLANNDTPNRQIILITDGLPTAHFEGSMLYLLYPPDPLTERATMREGQLCQREGITINIFLVPSWSQSEEDIRFAYRLAESTKGRVFFTAGNDLDRYVVWDYVNRKREILG